MIDNITETRLDNGLVVLTDRMPDVRSATLGFFLRKGSRHEPDELNGISHFIEHTVFKGSKNRSALDIAIETDRLGGNLDAFTTHEDTGFAIKVIDHNVPQAFDLIAEMLAEPVFDRDELRNEKRVIIEEMKMVDDSPEEHLSEIFSREFFPDHPLGMNIVGTPETVKRFDREVTSEYHRRVFSGSNLVIAAAGNVRHDEIVTLATRYFSSNGKLGPETGGSTSVPKVAAPIVIKQNDNLEQAHLVIASPFISAVDERRYAADLLANMMGGGTSSRLWQTIREKRGLAYSVGASAVMFSDCGFFSIFAGTSPEQTGEVLDLSIGEMRRILDAGVSESELQLVKDQTTASILLGLEDSAARAATLAHSEMLHGRQIPVEETLEKVRGVTVDDVRFIAEEFFRTENIAVAALGDLNGLTIDRRRLNI